MITEGYTTLENTLRFYGTKKDVGADLPFNFELIKELTDQSNAPDFYKVVNSWLDHMPKHNWPNWVVNIIFYDLALTNNQGHGQLKYIDNNIFNDN